MICKASMAALDNMGGIAAEKQYPIPDSRLINTTFNNAVYIKTYFLCLFKAEEKPGRQIVHLSHYLSVRETQSGFKSYLPRYIKT